MSIDECGVPHHRWSTKGSDPSACLKCKVMRRLISRLAKPARRFPGRVVVEDEPRNITVIEYSRDGVTWSEDWIACTVPS